MIASTLLINVMIPIPQNSLPGIVRANSLKLKISIRKSSTEFQVGLIFHTVVNQNKHHEVEIE